MDQEQTRLDQQSEPEMYWGYPVMDRDRSEADNYKSQIPSKLVERAASFLPEEARIIDSGCGNGRNSIYFARLGHLVDAIDPEPQHFLSGVEGLETDVRDRIRFRQGSTYEESSYDGEYDATFMILLPHWKKVGDGANDLLFQLIRKHAKPSGLFVANCIISAGIAGESFYKRLRDPLNPKYFDGMLQRHGFDPIVFEVVRFLYNPPGEGQPQLAEFCHTIARKK